MAINYDIKIIGIYGPSGAGKDTLAQIIQNSTMPIKGIATPFLSFKEILAGERLNMLSYSRFEIAKFSAAPKRMVAELLGVPVTQLEDRGYKKTVIEKYGKTVLQLIIDVAENLKQKIHEEIWSDTLLNQHKDQFWLITDLRFPYEYDAIRAKGGMCVKLTNKDVVSTLPIDNLLDDREFDFHFENDFKDWKTMIWGVRRFLYQYHLYHEYAESVAYMDELLKR